MQTIQLFLATCIMLASVKSHAQNIMINVMSQNSGKISKGDSAFFEVTIYNTSPVKSLAPYKLRPQISFPFTIVSIPEKGHILPQGWSILTNRNGTVTLSNGTDEIPENSSRTILISMYGENIGGPAVVLGTLYFSNGAAPGISPGSPTKEDTIADNTSSSTITIY